MSNQDVCKERAREISLNIISCETKLKKYKLKIQKLEEEIQSCKKDDVDFLISKILIHQTEIDFYRQHIISLEQVKSRFNILADQGADWESISKEHAIFLKLLNDSNGLGDKEDHNTIIFNKIKQGLRNQDAEPPVESILEYRLEMLKTGTKSSTKTNSQALDDSL